MRRARATVRPLVASLAAGLKGDDEALERIRELCRRRRHDVADDFFLTAGLATVRAAACPPDCAEDDGCEFGDICRHMETIRTANLAEMARISRELAARDGRLDGPPVLMGEAAVLMGLYRTLEAFRARLWIVGVPGYDPEEERSAMSEAVAGGSERVRIGHLGRLEPIVEEITNEVELLGRRWRVPRRELLAVLLAARVGEPDATPLPPMWVHLAVALETWRSNVEYDQVLEVAERLELGPQTHRGLAVTATIVPRLREWLPVERLQVPWWERAIGVPLAARRLLDEAIMASPAFGPDG